VGFITLSLDLLHLRSLAIVHEGGRVRATFHTLPYRYLFSSCNSLVWVLSRYHQIIRPRNSPYSESHNVVLSDIILTIPDYLG
jgi:hypothetical protein